MIDAIKNGNVRVFEEAYILYRKKLFAYFLNKTNNAEDAKDLLQTAFFKLWQYRKSLSNEYLLEQHIFHIARTVYIDYLRKENKLQKIKVSANLQTNIPQLSNCFAEFDLRMHLQNILSRMPLQRRRIFELHKLEGYSYKEIADMLAIPVKSVDNHLAKAMKYIRNTMLLVLIFLSNIH